MALFIYHAANCFVGVYLFFLIWAVVYIGGCVEVNLCRSLPKDELQLCSTSSCLLRAIMKHETDVYFIARDFAGNRIFMSTPSTCEVMSVESNAG